MNYWEESDVYLDLQAEKQFEVRLRDLQLNLNQSESHKQSIQNYVDFLKNSYSTMFDEGPMLLSFGSSYFPKWIFMSEFLCDIVFLTFRYTVRYEPYLNQGKENVSSHLFIPDIDRNLSLFLIDLIYL